MRRRAVFSRILMLVLMLNLCWLPTRLRAWARPSTAAPATADCLGPPLLVDMQAGLWERLGWSGYSWCEAWATTDQDAGPVAPDPNEPNAPEFGQLLTGVWADQPFVLSVEQFWPLTDWAAVFPDDPNLAATATAMNANAGFGVGVINESAEVVFLVVAGDDIWHGGGRFRGLLVLGWHPWSPWTSRLLYYRGDDQNQQEFQRCINEAEINRRACLDLAFNELMRCLISDALVAGAVGGAVGCLISGFKRGAGVAGIKALLAWCGLGALVGFAVQILACILDYLADKDACKIRYRRDLARCRLLCPPPSPPAQPERPPLPPHPPAGPPMPALNDPNTP